MDRRTSALKLWIACAPLLVACSSPEKEPVSGQQLALTAEQNVERALRGAHQAGSFIADSAVLAKALSSGSKKDCYSTPCAVGTQCPEVDCQPEDAVTVADLQDDRDELGDSIDDLMKVLREEVFTPQNLEAEDGDGATYLLGPDTLCEADSASGSPVTPGSDAAPAPESTLDADCVENAQKLQPRLRLSPAGSGVNVALLLTAQRRNPVTFELGSDDVGVVVDLGEIKAAMDASGESSDSLAALSGKVELELHRNAERDYSFRVNVLSPVALGVLDDLQQRVDVALGATSPAFELRLDGNARKVSGNYHVGALSVHGPLNAFRENFDDDEPVAAGTPATEKTYTGTIDALLAGLDGGVTLSVDGNEDKLALVGLGLGEQASTLKFDGATVAQVDLNPNAGRHFDLALEKVGDEQVAMTFSPTFDLNVLLKLAPLANQLTNIPAYALDDTLRVWFDGANPRIQSEPDQLRVLSGTLKVSSRAVPQADIEVPSGSCLLDAPSGTPVAHELLSELVAGTCK